MSAKFIGVAYLYLVSLISLFVIVGGIFSSVETGLKIVLYDKYPGRFGPPVDICRTGPPVPFVAKLPSDESISTPSAQELEKWKKECEEGVAIQSKGQKVEDITRSIMMILVGGVLFAYHFPKARKSSN